MSVYRRTLDGRLVKIAGLFSKTFNTKWFTVTRSIIDGVEYYTIDNSDLSYFIPFKVSTAYFINFREANTTTSPKLRIDNKVFDLYNVDAGGGIVEVGQLKSILTVYTDNDLNSDLIFFRVGQAEQALLKVDQLIDGTTPANKAINDKDGNDIVDTYTTKSELEELSNDLIKIVNGTIPVNRAINDKNGSPIDTTYATLTYVNGAFTPRTFFENLYCNRTGVLTADLTNIRPTANANNYLTTTTTNTSLNYSSTTKLVLSRILSNKLQLDANDSVKVTLSFATNRNASLEFGARVLIDNVPISSNQAFGLNTIDGDSAFTSIHDTTFNITCNLIIGTQEFAAGKTLTVEIFTRQTNTQSLITRYFCGVAIGGADRHCFVGINATGTSINTDQISDGAVTLIKLAGEVTGLINGKEPAFEKNTAFNKDFGTGKGTVCEGNDGRLNNLLPDANGAINAGGRKSGSTVGNNSVGIGKDCEARLNSVSIGTNSKATTSSVAIGKDARFVGASERDSYIIIGPSSEVSDYGAIAIGSGAKGYAINAISIGANSQANANNSVQIGQGTNEASNTLQYLSKRIIDSGGNLYQNNIKLQELYEPLLDVDKLVPSVDNGWLLGGASGPGSVVLTKGRWLIKITNSEKGNSRIGQLYYDGTDNSAGCDIPGEDRVSTYRAIYTAPGWYWYRLVNGAWENLGGGAVYAKKI